MQTLRSIAVVHQNPASKGVTEDALRAAGFTKVVHLDLADGVMAQIQASDPLAILLVLEQRDDDLLREIFQITEAINRPVALITQQSDGDTVQAAVSAGISACALGKVSKEQVRHVLDECVARFNALSELRGELARVKTVLEERKLIDRAKGILMAKKCMTEDQAYAFMRSAAMNENRRIADVAQSVMAEAGGPK